MNGKIEQILENIKDFQLSGKELNIDTNADEILEQLEQLRAFLIDFEGTGFEDEIANVYQSLLELGIDADKAFKAVKKAMDFPVLERQADKTLDEIIRLFQSLGNTELQAISLAKGLGFDTAVKEAEYTRKSITESFNRLGEELAEKLVPFERLDISSVDDSIRNVSKSLATILTDLGTPLDKIRESIGRMDTDIFLPSLEDSGQKIIDTFTQAGLSVEDIRKQLVKLGLAKINPELYNQVLKKLGELQSETEDSGTIAVVDEEKAIENLDKIQQKVREVDGTTATLNVDVVYTEKNKPQFLRSIANA